jgi:hypothetical protein
MNPNLEITRRSAARKLHPDRIGTSTFVRSLLGYLVSERWTYPHFTDLRCAEDGMLCANESESEGYARLLCSRNDLVRAILVIAVIADLTPSERSYLLARIPEGASAKNRQ